MAGFDFHITILPPSPSSFSCSCFCSFSCSCSCPCSCSCFFLFHSLRSILALKKMSKETDLESNFHKSLKDFKEPKPSFPSLSSLWSTVDQARKDVSPYLSPPLLGLADDDFLWFFQSVELVSGSASSLYSTVQSAPKTLTGSNDSVAAETCGMSIFQVFIQNSLLNPLHRDLLHLLHFLL